MDIHELFEQHYSDHNDTTAENVKSCRLSNGSYNNLPIARAFRMFKAGFEANQGEKVQLLGYLSDIGALRASQGSAAYFKKTPSGSACVPVYTKQCEPLKLEMKHEKQ